MTWDKVGRYLKDNKMKNLLTFILVLFTSLAVGQITKDNSIRYIVNNGEISAVVEKDVIEQLPPVYTIDQYNALSQSEKDTLNATIVSNTAAGPTYEYTFQDITANKTLADSDIVSAGTKVWNEVTAVFPTLTIPTGITELNVPFILEPVQDSVFIEADPGVTIVYQGNNTLTNDGLVGYNGEPLTGIFKTSDTLSIYGTVVPRDLAPSCTPDPNELAVTSTTSWVSDLACNETDVDPTTISGVSNNNGTVTKVTTGLTGGTGTAGSFGIRQTAPGNAFARLEWTWTAAVNDTYDITIRARSSNSDPNVSVTNPTGLSGVSYTPITGTWTEYTFSATATSTSPIFRVYSADTSGSAAQGELEIDYIRIVKTN
jgi:hypothetical protein